MSTKPETFSKDGIIEYHHKETVSLYIREYGWLDIIKGSLITFDIASSAMGGWAVTVLGDIDTDEGVIVGKLDDIIMIRESDYAT